MRMNDSTTSQDPKVEEVIVHYLRNKGYSKAEQVLREEAKLLPKDSPHLSQDLSDAGMTRFILGQTKEESLPDAYERSYSAYRNWAQSSLDLYKPELLMVLYPLFVHCYLDLVERGTNIEAIKFLKKHRKDHPEKLQQELRNLENVTTPEHMKENELVQNFRNHKFNITMCSYSFELLLAYLHERKFMLLLSILNQYLNVKVHSGQPKPRDPETLYVPISGETEKDIANLHKKDVYWGLFEDQKKYTTIYADDEMEGREPKRSKSEGEIDESPKSNVTLPELDEQTEQEITEDLRKQKRLGPNRLPSICFYTFFNTYDTFNNICTSRRGNLVAVGFSDSTIKLWDLENDNSRWSKATKNFVENDGRDKVYTKAGYPRERNGYYPLIAHSGPVYGLSFSPDSQFLLSCSQDSTTRLWNMETKTNVVCYRGHSYPVWDVEFSPLGYYFATASHDRSARLWATNHTQPLRVFAGHLSDVNCVKFHPNCNYVVTGSSDKCVRIWDVSSGDCVRILTGHYASIYALSVSSDGRFIASAGEDKDILLWDLATSKRIATFKGHESIVWSLDFSEDGNLLASGSADRTVRLWDIKGLREELVRKEKEEEEANKVFTAEDVMAEPEETENQPENENGEAHETNPDAKKEDEVMEEEPSKPAGLLATFPTKKTPVMKVCFTRTNLLLASGTYKKDKKETTEDQT